MKIIVHYKSFLIDRQPCLKCCLKQIATDNFGDYQRHLWKAKVVNLIK